MLDKTVDVYKGNAFKGSYTYSTDVRLCDIIPLYLEKAEFDRIVIKEWKDGKEIKTINIEK
jgi:hypothetical protein